MHHSEAETAPRRAEALISAGSPGTTHIPRFHCVRCGGAGLARVADVASLLACELSNVGTAMPTAASTATPRARRCRYRMCRAYVVAQRAAIALARGLAADDP